ncbi:MAG: RibD family protein [Cyanobacteria bacterium J06638_22]
MTRIEPRPRITVVLAMSADGKIADAMRSPARFGSDHDRAHLEARLAEADAVLSGASTLRAYGTILPISSPEAITARQDRQQPPQPIYIICSHSGRLDPTLRFFRQPVPRWLLTTEAGGVIWQKEQQAGRFETILTVPEHGDSLNWAIALPTLYQQGIRRLVLAGGGQLVASLLAMGAIDELWLTLCPLLLGGKDAPTPVDGVGLPTALAPRLQLCSVKTVEDEVFLHYKVRPQVDAPPP